MSRFLLRKLDVATGCILKQALFSTEDVTSLAELMDVESLKPGMSFHLDANEFRLIADSFSVEIEQEAAHGELLCISDNFRFDPESHTGRELLLMLAGTKPFAAFAEIYPSEIKEEIIPESYFEQFVKSGKILKFEHVEKQNEKIAHSIRRVMYALPGEEWRVNAYVMLWKLAHKHGWNEGFERIEGYLLGYEDKKET